MPDPCPKFSSLTVADAALVIDVGSPAGFVAVNSGPSLLVLML